MEYSKRGGKEEVYLRVAIQGELGSNSHLAVQALLGEAELVPCTLSVEVFEQLAKMSADAAVLPIENSLHGAVADHSDLLLKHDVRIVGELSLRIRHALIAPAVVAVAELRRVLSHPVALSQCRSFFAMHRQLEAVPFYDTAGAVKHLVRERALDVAAIAAPFAAEVYGAHILLRDLEDDPQNFTRFLLLTRAADEARVRPAGSPINKVSLAFDLPHRPGSLQHALARLAGQGADLTRIESRPVPGRPWEYMFFVDLRVASAEAADAVLQTVMEVSHSAKELGRYAAGELHKPEMQEG